MPPDAVEWSPAGVRLRWLDRDAELAAADLRAACRCGACRAVPPQVDPAVQLSGVEPVGQYALQLLFTDGHDRGIYPWSLLQDLGYNSRQS
jgi:DUF971 family protein